MKYSLGHVVSSTLFALRTCVTRGAGRGRPLFSFGPTQLLMSHHLPDLTRNGLASKVRKPPLTQIVFLPLSVPGRRLEGTRNFLLVHTGICRKGCHFLASGTTGGPQVEDANGVAWGLGTPGNPLGSLPGLSMCLHPVPLHPHPQPSGVGGYYARFMDEEPGSQMVTH